MTPEERITKIENLLHSLTEGHVQLQIEMQRHDTQIAKNSELIEKNATGIRDLIVVSRTLLEAQVRTEGSMKTLANKMEVLVDTVHEHEGKMEALIDTVDRIIRRNEKE